MESDLHEAWRDNESIRQFIEKLTGMFNDVELTEFDFNFLSNWLEKKHKGRLHHADEQARSLAILLSNRLGEKLYLTFAPMMGLPSHRQVQRIRSKDMDSDVYFAGVE